MENTNFYGQVYVVQSPLDEIIRHFYHLQTPVGAKSIVKKLIPNFEILLIFNLGSPIGISFNDEALSQDAVKRMAVIGPLRKMMNYELQGGTDAISIIFTLNGFYRLFKIPITELADYEIIDPETWPNCSWITNLWTELKALSNPKERIELIGKRMITLIANNDPGFEALMGSIPYFNNPAIQPVKAIAYEKQLTERTVQQRFRKYLGFSPKEMLRYIRFKNLVNQVLNQENKMIDLFDLIETYGYHDQSHLIKDFNHFMGTTPGKFIKDIAGKDFCMSKPGKNY